MWVKYFIKILVFVVNIYSLLALKGRNMFENEGKTHPNQ